MLYEIRNGTVSLGGEAVLSHFDFGIHGNEKIAIVGPNGVGKSTLLRLMAGELELDRDDKRAGEIRMARSLVIGYLPQIVEAGELTVQDLIMEACPCKDEWDRERFLYEQEYDRMFTAMGFRKEDKEKRMDAFSGGQQVRIALIRLMLLKPDILLLDEPTNHLDQEMTQWLEEWIAAYDKAVVYVSHDRYFMDMTADAVCEVRKGSLRRYAGNYSAYVEQRQKELVILRKEWEGQQAEIERLNALIKKFHNKPRKASFARSRQKILDRMEVMEKPDAVEIRPSFGELIPERISGKRVLVAEKVELGYDKNAPLLKVDLEIRRGQRIGIIGPNGIGKSTFLKTLAGVLAPLAGRVSEGMNVEVAYYDQQILLGNEELSALDHFHKAFPGLTEGECRKVLARWGIRGKEAATPVKGLSGGERSRLRFAELFQSCPNCLILDEPGNHLDMAAKEVLESALKAYKGTVIFVSHDRYFIDQVAGSLLIFSREAQGTEVNYYPFSYSHYKKQHKKTALHIRAEEMAMVESFRNVPEKEKGMLREYSTEQAYLDWKLGLLKQELEPVLVKVEKLETALSTLQEEARIRDWLEWLNPDSTEAETERDAVEKQDISAEADKKAEVVGKVSVEADKKAEVVGKVSAVADEKADAVGMVSDSADMKRSEYESERNSFQRQIETLEAELALARDEWTRLCIAWDDQLHEGEEEDNARG